MKSWFPNTSKKTDKRKRSISLFGDYSIRTKLIISFLVVSILPLISIAIRDTLQTQQALTNVAEISLKSGAQQTANSLDNFIQTTLNSMGAEAQLADFINYLSLAPARRSETNVQERTLDLLKNLGKRDSKILSYGLVDSNGNVLLDSATDIQHNESREAYFSPVQFSETPLVSYVVYEKDNITTSLTFASAVKNLKGAFIGVLRVKYSASVLQDVILKSVGSAPDTSVLLLDQRSIRMADSQNPQLIFKSITPLNPIQYSIAVNNRRLLDTSPEEQATNYVDFEAAVDNAINKDVFRADITPNIKGDDTIAVAFLQTQPWIVTYSRPTSIFLAEVQNQTRTNIILVLGALFIISIMTALIARSLTNPITALAKVANLISQGDLNARAQVQSRDEIGTLAGSFNVMTNQLQEALNSLEKRVAERTAVAESARAEAESARKDIEVQMWLAAGQAVLAEKMRGEQSIPQLAGSIISQLSQYLGAQAGALYLLDGKTLKIVAGYAFASRPGFSGEFQIGEGLVGQTAADQGIRLLNCPENARPISSGLVDILPRQVLMIPFEENGQLAGVIELATLTEFTQAQMGFLARVSENIGVAFRTVQARQRLADVLMETQQQTEELQAQEEELRAANEELQAQAENLKAAHQTPVPAFSGSAKK